MKADNAGLSGCTVSVPRVACNAAAACVAMLAPVTVALAASADDTQRLNALVQRFVAAALSKSAEQRKSIIHPASLACMNPRTQPYFDWIFAKQFRIVAHSGPRVTVEPIGKDPAVLPTDGQSDYPVRPTHQVQMDFVTGPHSSSSVVLFVARDGGQWGEVLPCPRGDAQAQARAKEAAERKGANQIRNLKDSMPGTLREEILGLLRNGRKVEAIQRHAAATGTDVGLSKSVVESLAADQSSR